ncbi:MAG: hypothetical protein JST12_19165 [Armatimonadetes bacterium]|nr:hypothetical protein [Armatimonadota bacterium]
MIAVALALTLWQTPLYEREDRKIEGWSVHIRKELLRDEKDLTEKALTMIGDQLKEIKRVVPKAAVAELQKVPLWLSPEYPGIVPRAEYHPGAEWLKEHGRDPIMAKGIEFTNIRIFAAEVKRMPIFVLHELAHAYHDRVLGFDDPRIKTAFDHAQASGNYDHVLRSDGKTVKAYAMTNEREYFAEGTESYFGRNDFYPFDRKDLKEADPELFGIMQAVWTKPKG